MTNLLHFQGAESQLVWITPLLTKLIGFTKILFFSPVGWILIILWLVMLIFVKARQYKGEFSISGLMASMGETLFGFYSGLLSMLAGIAILAGLVLAGSVISEMQKSLRLYQEVQTLNAALKNLKAERRLMEFSAVQTNNDAGEALAVHVEYFNFSAVRSSEVKSGSDDFIIGGRKIYMDFGVFNFDYSLVEKGLEKNIAFPNRLYSDSVSPDQGASLSAAAGGIPMTFRLDQEDLFLLEKQEYEAMIARLMDAATNKSAARQLGLRTYYGESVAVTPQNGRKYSVYSTGNGGVILR